MIFLLQRGQMKNLGKEGRGAEDPSISLPIKKVVQGLRFAAFQWTLSCDWGRFPFLGNHKRNRKTEGPEEISKPAHIVPSYYICLDQISSTSESGVAPAGILMSRCCCERRKKTAYNSFPAENKRPGSWFPRAFQTLAVSCCLSDVLQLSFPHVEPTVAA